LVIVVTMITIESDRRHDDHERELTGHARESAQ